jgi:hypothetical protein
MLGAESRPDRRFDFADIALRKSELWQHVINRHNFRPSTLADFLRESQNYPNLVLGNALRVQAPPALVITIKIRQAGFSDRLNTEVSAPLVECSATPPMVAFGAAA